MRELTKSGLSAGLAMSIFGMQQMMNLFRRRRSDETPRTAEALNTVAQAMVDQSGEALRETFHAGDKLQRELVDMMFRMLRLGSANPPDRSSSFAGAARRTQDQVRRWMGGMGASGGCSCRGGQEPDEPRGAWRGTSEASAAWRQAENFAARREPASGQEPGAQGWGPIPPDAGTPAH